MTKNSQTQTGSAHSIIIIILVLALLGTLGFIFWQNFVQTPMATTTVADDTKSKQKEYSNSLLSFNYPTSGWTVDETQYGENGPVTPELKSSDYQASIGMGVDKGAIIFVSVNVKATTIDEEYVAIQSPSSGFYVEEALKVNLGGKEAITYHSAYEGTRYHTIFVHGGKVYDVIYMYEDNGDASTYMDTYNLVTSSLKFKE